MTTVEERAAQPGAEREHEFESLAGDNSGTVDLGIVEDDDRDTQCLAQRGARVEAVPLLHQVRIDTRAGPSHRHIVRRSDDDTVANHAGQAHGGVCRCGHLLGEVDESLYEELRRQGVRRGHPDGLGSHRAGFVEDGCLDPAAPAVDHEGGDRGVFCAHATSVCPVRPGPGNLTRQVLGGVA